MDGAFRVRPVDAALLGERRVVVMAEKSWEGFFLTSSLKKAGVDVAAMVVQREPIDGIVLSPGGWRGARKQVGLRLSTRGFFGAPLGFAYHLRRLLHRSDYPLLGDIRRLGIPVERVEAFKSSACHDVLRRLRPQVVVICGTPILPESLLSIPEICTLNIHTSMLPHYRGGGSLFWPLFFRDTDKVGITIHKAVAALDAGPWLHQERIPVTPGDTPATLLKKCFKAAAPKIATILKTDPLGEESWRRYEKPLTFVHRRPHPEVSRDLLGSPRTQWIKKLARNALNKVRHLSRGTQPTPGQLNSFFFHRILPDRTPPDDWRRVLGHPTVSELREKLAFLKRTFQVVSLSQWLAVLELNDTPAAPHAVVTIDDGYRDFRTDLLPLLEELNVPATLFVCTGGIETNSVWYQRVYNLIHQVQSEKLFVPWMDTRIHFGDVRHRVLTVERVLLAQLKRFSRTRRMEMVDRLIEENDALPTSTDIDAFCSVEDLQFLKRSPLVELHPHSHEHDPFETLAIDELQMDLTRCKRFFSEKLALDFSVLSYPNGQFKDEQRQLMGSLGIRYAMTTANGSEKPGKFDPLALRRYGFGNEPLADFIFRLRRGKVLR
jgi:peptidoglycan/xylan/chitin deacetylase (PgdA/CDA1 family)